MLRVFSHYIPKSLVVLVIIEALLFYAAVYLGIDIRFMDSVNSQQSIELLQPINNKAIVFSILMLLSMTAMGLHTRHVVDDFSSLMIRIFLSFGAGFFILTIVYYLYPELVLGRGVVAITFVLSFIGILITRTFHQKIDNHTIFKRRVFILGAGNKAHVVELLINKALKQGYEVCGFLENNCGDIKVSKNRLLEIKTNLLDLCLENEIDEIILALDDRRNQFPGVELIECKMRGIIIRDLSDYFERVTGHIELNAVHQSTIIFSDGFTNAVKMSGVKRSFDIFSSLLILIITSPIFVLTSIAIWASSLGQHPVLYRQVRVGLCNKPFNVLKFRSMKMDAEKNGAQFAQKHDSRVTKIGKFIRATRIDELPQLINVLKGDMSFIGPRPERPEFVLGYEQSIPHYALRHTVKPGITGWAQISYPYSDTDEDTKNKLQYDLYYIKNYSIFLDMTILLQTIQVVLFGQGSR